MFLVCPIVCPGRQRASSALRLCLISWALYSSAQHVMGSRKMLGMELISQWLEGLFPMKGTSFFPSGSSRIKRSPKPRRKQQVNGCPGDAEKDRLITTDSDGTYKRPPGVHNSAYIGCPVRNAAPAPGMGVGRLSGREGCCSVCALPPLGGEACGAGRERMQGAAGRALG